MLLSYFVPQDKQFHWRWLFGVGMSIFLIAIGVTATSLRQEKSSFAFTNTPDLYKGIVIDVPQQKLRSIACKVNLADEDKKIVCYLQIDTLDSKQLNLGDEFLFYSKIQPFKNISQMQEFDYVRYMHNQGFAGMAYIPSQAWELTGNTSSSLQIKALKCRQQILGFYKSLGFDDVEYSILSALTLGYQDELSDDLKQGFRTTGTVHVLSVSGLHVGIIYLMISFLLGFIRKRSAYYWLKPVLIILLLWVYAFITGLPPSVVRASAMLTVFCAAELFKQKSNPVHALYIAAFFMLLINPLMLFDIGFQLSFLSVLAILYLHPKASGLVKVKNKYARQIWQMFTLSLVAQLATFPLCLYYFGTFPTYFFVANLLIVPLVSLITYVMGAVFVAKIISAFLPTLGSYLFYLPVKVLQFLVKLMTVTIEYIEDLPFALVEDMKISFADLLFIYGIIIGILCFLILKRPKVLIASLAIVLCFILMHVYKNIEYVSFDSHAFNATNRDKISVL